MPFGLITWFTAKKIIRWENEKVKEERHDTSIQSFQIKVHKFEKVKMSSTYYLLSSKIIEAYQTKTKPKQSIIQHKSKIANLQNSTEHLQSPYSTEYS